MLLLHNFKSIRSGICLNIPGNFSKLLLLRSNQFISGRSKTMETLSIRLWAKFRHMRCGWLEWISRRVIWFFWAHTDLIFGKRDKNAELDKALLLIVRQLTLSRDSGRKKSVRRQAERLRILKLHSRLIKSVLRTGVLLISRCSRFIKLSGISRISVSQLFISRITKLVNSDRKFMLLAEHESSVRWTNLEFALKSGNSSHE